MYHLHMNDRSQVNPLSRLLNLSLYIGLTLNFSISKLMYALYLKKYIKIRIFCTVN